MNLQEQFVQFYEQSGYTQPQLARAIGVSIVALRNEKGSYNIDDGGFYLWPIVALRNEKGS